MKDGYKSNPQFKHAVDVWGKAGKKLQEIRDNETRTRTTSESLLALADAFEHAVQISVLRSSSGLVEQQRLFSMARK